MNTTFTPDQESAAVDGIGALKGAQQEAVEAIISDWVRMRDADRACIAQTSPTVPPKGN